MVLNVMQNVKSLLVGLVRLGVNFSYDFYTCARYSNFVFSHNKKEARCAAITAQIHNIEKGLSLPRPRAGFGKANMNEIFKNLKFYLQNYGVDDLVGRAQATLREYVRFNEAHGCEDYPHRDDIAWLLNLTAPQQQGGVLDVSGSQLRQLASGVSEEFFFSRHSIRDYCAESVDMAKVTRAIKIAQKSPSVCNRQSGYVYILTKKAEIAEALELQGGADGFADKIPMLLVLTTRTSDFWSGERNQRWVDGGLFAMSLIYGLHREGLGSCALNWCKSARQDLRFKKRMRIPGDRAILFLLAVGNIPEKLHVARSEKRPLEEMYEIR